MPSKELVDDSKGQFSTQRIGHLVTDRTIVKDDEELNKWFEDVVKNIIIKEYDYLI
jgi:hypothetical protein